MTDQDLQKKIEEQVKDQFRAEISEMRFKIEQQAHLIEKYKEKISILEKQTARNKSPSEIEKIKPRSEPNTKKAKKEDKSSQRNSPKYRSCVICHRRFRTSEATRKICNICLKDDLKSKSSSPQSIKGSNFKYTRVIKN
ncbi:hypothetical protein [Billgrantia montanilacus]|uniref:hypothetical protein n=1 Tax=Billgrantia montanilacus TaxID=2282305 RepID=UPI0011C05C5C|nr:hypothetical protein [Halomonas montanilacus]